MRSVKAKIRAGTIFLFVLVVISGACSIYYLVKFKTSSENIIQANYESLEYAHGMQIALDSVVRGNIMYKDSLFHCLSQQESNITEPGEGEATLRLRTLVVRLEASDTTVVPSIRSVLQQVLSLNMSAIKMKSMNFMRGRTFLNKYVIIDEAQNLTPKQMKTLITRAGPGTKIICMGNLAQIDTPYLTETTSGLTYAVDRFKNWAHSAHVSLRRGERSRLADFASEVL